MIGLILSVFLAQAATLTYKVDKTMGDSDLHELFEICGFPETFTIDQKAPLAPTLIKRMFTFGKVSTTRIQATRGAVSGGGAPEAYQGEYREKVYLVKQELPDGLYAPGVYTRVAVTTYGSTAAPSGFVANSALLNHRYSAELAEGDICGNVYYKLQK